MAPGENEFVTPALEPSEGLLTLILDSWTPELPENTFLLSDPVCGHLLTAALGN